MLFGGPYENTQSFYPDGRSGPVRSRGGAPALAKPRKPKDADWTETFDVIVIGSGLAAFVAGLSALESGAKRVALLEKMGMIGGSTAISNGTISVPGSPLQKAQGIEDSPEAMLKDLLKAGKGFCHPELTKTLVGNGVEAFDFIVKHGAKFKDTVMMPGGMTAKRLLQPDYNGATGLLAPLRESYLKMGGPAHLVLQGRPVAARS